MIFDDSPSDWHQLEARVAQTFNEMGCKATTDVTISKIRSNSLIDVYVEDPTLSPPAIYLCECKYWRKSVHKGVVQQFRTIISDAGANLGIIISQKKFQSGAYEEADKTNVRLYSWLDFQKAFAERWTNAMVQSLERLRRECDYLQFEAYATDSTPEADRLTRELREYMWDKTSLYVEVWKSQERVVQKSQSVRICETRAKQTASQKDRWVELRTKREFFDYAVHLTEELIRKHQERLAILRAHPPR